MTAWLWCALAMAEPLEALDRVEIAVDGTETWEVVPLGEEGLVLVGTEDRGHALSVRRYDASFREMWTSELAFDARTMVYDTDVAGGRIWFAVGRPGKEFSLVGLDPATGARVDVPWSTPKTTFDVTSLVVHEPDTAWVLATAGLRSSFLAIGLDGSPAELLDVPGALGVRKAWPKSVLVGPGPEDRTLTVEYLSDDRSALALLPFGPQGLGEPLRLEAPEGDRLLTGVPVPRSEDAGMVLGTYATGEHDTGAQGLYVAGYERGAQTWTKEWDFQKLAHFFDYLPDRARARVAEAAERRAENGKDLELNYVLVPRAPLLLDDRTVFVAEACEAQYMPVTRTTTTTVNGVTTTHVTTTMVFVGWLYTHAIITAFDRQGELLWDASVPIGNVQIRDLRPVVAVLPAKDHMTVMYASNGKLYSVVADANGVTGERGEQAPLPDEEGEVKRSWSAQSVWWYRDVFLTWGYEVVKTDAGRRTVFQFSTLRPS